MSQCLLHHCPSWGAALAGAIPVRPDAWHGLLLRQYSFWRKSCNRETAERLLTRGHQRLLSYGVEGGGFSWFGKAPAHRILTAYGLLEFRDMSDVHAVDPAVIERTQEWLVRLQEADGSWNPDSTGIREGAINKFSDDVFRTTAYIALALARSGYGGTALSGAEQWLVANLDKAEDTYTIALAANVLALLENDIVRTAKGVFLLDRSGNRRRLFECGENGRLLCFDGRYAWVAADRFEDTSLHALDMDTGADVHFVEADGMPDANWDIAGTALAPGEVCVLGTERSTNQTLRSWVARFQIGASVVKTVDMVLEGVLQSSAGASPAAPVDAPLVPNLQVPTFLASSIFTIGDPGGGRNQRVVLGNGMLLDPWRKQLARIDCQSGDRSPHMYCPYEGCLYWVDFDGSIRRPSPAYMIHRVGVGQTKMQPASCMLSQEQAWGATLTFCGVRVHVVGRMWLTAPDLRSPFVEMAARVPGQLGFHALFPSNVYGLVLNDMLGSAYQVRLAD